MKNFLKSAFALSLYIIIGSLLIAYRFSDNSLAVEIFTVIAIVYLILLPSCSTKN
jgi:hypothetical protein